MQHFAYNSFFRFFFMFFATKSFFEHLFLTFQTFLGAKSVLIAQFSCFITIYFI